MKSEDPLYEFIISRMNEDFSFFSFFEFVRFDYLSSTTISNFSKVVCEDCDVFNVSILSAICVHLNQTISRQTVNLGVKEIEIIPNVSTPLEEIERDCVIYTEQPA
jgi:hypothetical protein